jgi:hypothetical protein
MPDTVNFYRVAFRENNTVDQNFPWPDGINIFTKGAWQSSINPQDEYVLELGDYFPNVYLDAIGTLCDYISCLWKDGEYHGCTFDIRVPLELQDDNGTWHVFETAHHLRIYIGLYQTLRIEDDGTYNIDTGDIDGMGPYAETP